MEGDPSKAKQSKAKQGKAKQSKGKQSKAKQSKKKQSKAKQRSTWQGKGGRAEQETRRLQANRPATTLPIAPTRRIYSPETESKIS